MDIVKFKKYLNKVNHLEDWFDDSEIDISEIEKDLLLEYLRKMYDAAIFSSNDEYSPAIPKTEKKVKSSEPYHDAQKPKEQPKKEEKTSKPAPKIPKEKTIKNQPNIEKRVVEKADTPVQEQIVVVKPETQEVPITVVEPQIIKAETNQSNYHFSGELLDAFSIKQSNELSEKLSQMPISDLTKAFGLNERIFNTNELFGGDNALFDQVINKLNSFNRISEAKEFLLNEIAVKYQWDSEGKQKKAVSFIRTIKRRYL